MFLGMLALMVLQSSLLNTQSANPPPTSGDATAWYLSSNGDPLPLEGTTSRNRLPVRSEYVFAIGVQHTAKHFYPNVSVILPL